MVEFNKIEFGNKLREARLKKNYTLKYVGTVIGKDLSTVRKYETGEVINYTTKWTETNQPLYMYSKDNT